MDEKILSIIALHPWIDTEQVAALAGCGCRWAGQQLRRLAADSLVQSCQVAGLCTSGDLFALSTRGSRQAALPDYVTRGFVSQALLRAEALWGTRNLLAMLARRDELAWSVSPGRARFADARGNEVALDLEAVGEVRKSDRRIPFGVMWDIGEVDPLAFVPRFSAIYQWSQSEKYRGREHDCDCEYASCEGYAPREGECFPTIVIVTINQHRAWQLMSLWQQAAERNRVSLIPCCVGVWREVAEGSSAAWLHAGGGTDRVNLFHNVVGLPAEAIDGDLSTRARASCEYASREGGGADGYTRFPTKARAISLNVLPGDKSGDTADLLRAHLGVPDRQARRVLRRVAAWPLLTGGEIALLLGEHPKTVRASLGTLVDIGLIATHLVEENQAGYYLTALGIQLLALACGQTPSRYARLRRWPIAHGNQPPQLNLPVLVNSLAHTREVRAFFVSLASLAEHYRRDLKLDHALVSWDEAEARRYYQYGGSRRTLAPDSGGLYRIGDKLYEFFLEVDRGSASRPRLARKFCAYYVYFSSGEFRRAGERMPQVLVIVPDEARARLVRAVIVEQARLYGSNPLPAWVAVRDALDERGPGAPVWREVTRWRFEHCFDGFRSTPDSARMRLNLADVRHEVATHRKKQQPATTAVSTS